MLIRIMWLRNVSIFFVNYFISFEHYTLQCLRKYDVGHEDNLTLDLNCVRSD
jgi:hypothetical protein